MARLSIGLDIGHHQVRAVALAPPRGAQAKEGFRARVVATAQVARRDLDGDAKPLAAVLAEIETLLANTGAVTTHLGDGQTLVRFVPTMALPPERRQRVLRLELAQHADDNGDLAADAWEVPVPGEEIIHGCIISQPAAIIAGLADFRSAGLPPPTIAYGPATIANCVSPGELEGDQFALIVDIGATSTAVTLIGDGRLLACRQVPIGGDAFTEALMAGGLDRQAAEERKSHGDEPPPAPAVGAEAPDGLSFADDDTILPSTPPPPIPVRKREADAGFDALFEDDPPTGDPLPTLVADAATDSELLLDGDEPAGAAGTDTDNLMVIVDFNDPGTATPDEPDTAVDAPLPVTLSGILPPPPPLPSGGTIALGQAVLGRELQRPAEMLYAQLGSSVLWFKTQLKLDRLELHHVLLGGGGGALAGLDTYLQRRFNAPVRILDPFARLAVDRMPDTPCAWSTAIGLALSDPRLGGRDAVRLDLRPESLVRADFRRRHQVWPYVAAALLLLSTVVTGIVLVRRSAAEEDSIAALAKWKTEHDVLNKKLAELQQQFDAQGEDLKAIAGRIYAGRDMLYAIRALKEHVEDSKELWVVSMKTAAVGSSVPADDLGGRYRPESPPAKDGSDTSVSRGVLLVTGRVKFGAATTDTERDGFLKKWRNAIVDWSPEPAAPRLFAAQRMVEWSPKYRSSGPAGRTGKNAGGPATADDEGEFPFTVEFTFSPTKLEQITALRPTAGGER